MEGFYDIHCHILPGVDDGAENMKAALRLLTMEYQDGVRVIYLTPHFHEKVFETSEERIMKKYYLLRKKAQTLYPDLRVELGREFRAGYDMIRYLENKEHMTMGESRCVLTEFSSVHDFSFIKEQCYVLLSHGYKPIIAHAERYQTLYRKYDRLQLLSDMGALIQINAGSILGVNGYETKRFCKQVMCMNLLDFVGSDAHNTYDRIPLLGKCSKYIERKMGRSYMRRLLIKNPKKYLEEGRLEKEWK